MSRGLLFFNFEIGSSETPRTTGRNGKSFLYAAIFSEASPRGFYRATRTGSPGRPAESSSHRSLARHYPQGVYRYHSHRDANEHQNECLARGMSRLAAERALDHSPYALLGHPGSNRRRTSIGAARPRLQGPADASDPTRAAARHRRLAWKWNGLAIQAQTLRGLFSSSLTPRASIARLSESLHRVHPPPPPW